MPPDPDPADPDPVEMAAEILGDEAQKRAWLRTIAAVLKEWPSDDSMSGRVQYSHDMALVAIFDRIRDLVAWPPTDD